MDEVILKKPDTVLLQYLHHGKMITLSASSDQLSEFRFIAERENIYRQMAEHGIPISVVMDE